MYERLPFYLNLLNNLLKDCIMMEHQFVMYGILQQGRVSLKTDYMLRCCYLHYGDLLLLCRMQDILEEAENTVRKRAWNNHFSGGIGKFIITFTAS